MVNNLKTVIATEKLLITKTVELWILNNICLNKFSIFVKIKKLRAENRRRQRILFFDGN